jgi:hypothetical protein
VPILPYGSDDIGMVRLLLNDVDQAAPVFSDAEVQVFLDLEGGSVKRATAQAIDTNASNLLLATRVLRTQDLSTDGAKVADAMRAHADRLREQADREDGFFDIVEHPRPHRRPPELTEWPSC